MITFSCQCGKKYKVEDKFAGRQVRCRQCEATMTIPEIGVNIVATEEFPQPSDQATESLDESAKETDETESYANNPNQGTSVSTVDATIDYTPVAAEKQNDQDAFSTTLPSPDQDQCETPRPASTTGQNGTPLTNRGNYGSHRIVRAHAKGGMGQVSIARDQYLKREVALKELFESATGRKDIIRRFLDEAEITARLEHPGIVPVHAFGVDGQNKPYYTMKFVRGKTFQAAINEYHALSEKSENKTAAFRDLVRRFAAVCQTMSFAHDKGIIHRDLKPANIMLGEHGETLVMDWGLAKPFSGKNGGTIGELAAEKLNSRPEMTGVGKIIGTPAYMPPEQAAGKLELMGPQSDVYSLGAILYQILTGEIPFTGKSSLEIVQKVLAESPPKPSEVKKSIPKGLEAICLKAMSRESNDRYLFAEQLFDDLTNWLDDEPISVKKDTQWEKIWRWMRKNRMLATSIMVSVFGLLVILGVTGMIVERANSRAKAAAAVAEDYRQQAKAATQKADEKEQIVQKLEIEVQTRKENALALAGQIVTMLGQFVEIDNTIANQLNTIDSLNNELDAEKYTIFALHSEIITLRREIDELRQLASDLLRLAAGEAPETPLEKAPLFALESDWTKNDPLLFNVLGSECLFGAVSSANEGSTSEAGRSSLRVDYATADKTSLICPLDPTPESCLTDMRQLKFSLFIPENQKSNGAVYQPVSVRTRANTFRDMKIRIGCGSNYFEIPVDYDVLSKIQSGQWNDIVIPLREGVIVQSDANTSEPLPNDPNVITTPSPREFLPNYNLQRIPVVLANVEPDGRITIIGTITETDHVVRTVPIVTNLKTNDPVRTTEILDITDYYGVGYSETFVKDDLQFYDLQGNEVEFDEAVESIDLFPVVLFQRGEFSAIEGAETLLPETLVLVDKNKPGYIDINSANVQLHDSGYMNMPLYWLKLDISNGKLPDVMEHTYNVCKWVQEIRTCQYTVSKMVPEQRVKEVSYQVEGDGVVETCVKQVPYTVMTPVYETRERTYTVTKPVWETCVKQIPTTGFEFGRDISDIKKMSGLFPVLDEEQLAGFNEHLLFKSEVPSITKLPKSLQPVPPCAPSISLLEYIKSLDGIDENQRDSYIWGANREQSHWFELIITPNEPCSYYLIDDLHLSPDDDSVTGHTDTVFAVAFNENGEQILTGSGDYNTMLWNTKSRKNRQVFHGMLPYAPACEQLPCEVEAMQQHDSSPSCEAEWMIRGHADRVISVAFHPNSKQVLTASGDATLILWDKRTGMPIRQYQGGHQDDIWSVVFLSDGSRFLSGSLDGKAILWDTETGEIVREFNGHDGFVFSVAVNPNGTQFLTGSGDQTAILWDFQTGEQIRKFEGHTNQVRTVLFRPKNDQHVLTTSNDVTAILWNKETGEQVRKFEDLENGHRDGILTAVFNSDGTKLLTGSKDGSAILWNVETDEIIRKFAGHNGMVFSVAIHPDDSMILTGGGDSLAILWDANTGEQLHVFKTVYHTVTVQSAVQNFASPDSMPLPMGVLPSQSPIIYEEPQPFVPEFQTVNLLPDVKEPQQAPLDFLNNLKRIEDEIKEKGGFAVAGQVYIDGEPAKLSSDFDVNVFDRPTYHFKKGWFITRIFDKTNKDNSMIEALSLQTDTLKMLITPDEKKVNFYKVSLEKAPDDQLVDLKGRVVSEDNKPLKDAEISLHFSIGSGNFGSSGNTNFFEIDGITTNDQGQYVISRVFPRKYSIVSWHSGYETNYRYIDSSKSSIDDLVLSKHRKVIIDVVYQPDGSTDFTKENVKVGQFVLMTGNGDTATWDNPIGYSLRLDSNSKMSSWGHDFRFDVDHGQVKFKSNFGGNHGVYDLGEIDLSTVKEAEPDSLKRFYPQPSCQLNHVYVIRTYETQETGNYAKFIVRKIEIIEPEEM